MPKIEEVNRLIEVLRSIGVSVEWKGHDVVITAPEKVDMGLIDRDAATKTRSILMFIGSLIHSLNDFEIPQNRRVYARPAQCRPHVAALEKFGVRIEARP